MLGYTEMKLQYLLWFLPLIAITLKLCSSYLCQDKFVEFNNKTEDAWLDDSQTDLEFSINPVETAGMGLSKMNIHPSLPRDLKVSKNYHKRGNRPHLLPRQLSSPQYPTSDIYIPPRPASTSAGISTSSDYTS